VKLLIDENIGRPIVERLRWDGHMLTLAADQVPGHPDADVLALAYALDAVVLTEDTDFGDLVMRQHLPSAGVILLRLSGMPRVQQPDYVARILATHSAAMPQAFSVVTPTAVRTRPLP
jgi:predicted nuclease of predicted toxin-antitoxin system